MVSNLQNGNVSIVARVCLRSESWDKSLSFLDTKELSKEVGYSHGEKANDEIAKHGWLGWCFSQFRTGIASEDQG